MKTAPPPIKISRGTGAWLELSDGKRILDCISSWWVTLHGHGEPTIASAIHEQALRLEQVIFAGFTHDPAEDLVQSILSVVPPNLSRVFFSDDGSTAVEVALKMAYQYWQNIGFGQRNKFIGVAQGYHGDTVGAMSMGGTSTFWKPFSPLMFEVDCIPFPATWDGDIDVTEKENQSLHALHSLLSQGDERYAAIILEPLIQGVGGMRICREDFLRRLLQIAHEFELLVIYDEVMTGFGRTGDWFACTKSATEPDILCLSKGLTGGFLPLALTLASEKIYQAFYADETNRAFFHSHSYTGNPIACAAANASFSLLSHNQEAFRNMESTHRALIDKWIKGNPIFYNARAKGTIAAFEVVSADTSYYADISRKLKRIFVERGLLLRPIGNTVYLLPPYCITRDELEFAYEIISEVCTEL